MKESINMQRWTQQRVSANEIDNRLESLLYRVSEYRHLFRPVQPAVTNSNELVTYHEYCPALQIQPYIYCYWQLKTTQKLQQPFFYRVVADGCIDIAFDLKRTQESVVMGFHDTFNEFALESEFNYVGIRFLPAMFPVAFNVDASELSHCMLPLDNLLPGIARHIRNNANPQFRMDQLIRFLDDYFVRELAGVRREIDHRFFNALQSILIRQGTINIGSGIDTGLSSRQMRRLFNFYIGDSPKRFAKVVRFQNVLLAKPSRQSLRQNKLFFDGYYDQAHFIKEFRQFYGLTPSKAFS